MKDISLNKLADTWRSMDRSDESQQKIADLFYKTEILPRLQDKFANLYPERSCQYLILSLGTSIEPLLLSLSALKPDVALILCTPKTRYLLKELFAYTTMDEHQISVNEVDSENPLMIYKKILSAYEQWERPNDIFVDFTGGTKSMSAGCALAGAAIGAQLIYISSDYNQYLRRPNPGSEKICRVAAPDIIFDNKERKLGVELFNQYQYHSAGMIFSGLVQKAPEMDVYRFLCNLSAAYEAWDRMDLNEACEKMAICLDTLKDKDLSAFGDYKKHIEVLEGQFETLRLIASIQEGYSLKNDSVYEYSGILIANLFQNVKRRESLKQYETASLLLYRILEMIEQKRLWQYNRFETGKADYSKISRDESALLVRINAIRGSIGYKVLSELPSEVGLVMGYMILYSIGDPLLSRMEMSEQEIINILKEQVEIRNQSIYAHGYFFVEEKRFSVFKSFSEKLIQAFYQTDKINLNDLALIEFIKL